MQRNDSGYENRNNKGEDVDNNDVPEKPAALTYVRRLSIIYSITRPNNHQRKVDLYPNIRNISYG